MGIDFNIPEILFLGVLAVIIFGPEKLPELAKKAARIVSYLRRVGNDARAQLREELGPEFDDVRLSDLNPKTFVQRHILSADEVGDLRQMRDEALESGQLVRDELDIVRELSRPDDDTGGVAAEPVLGPVLYDPEAT